MPRGAVPAPASPGPASRRGIFGGLALGPAFVSYRVVTGQRPPTMNHPDSRIPLPRPVLSASLSRRDFVRTAAWAASGAAKLGLSGGGAPLGPGGSADHCLFEAVPIAGRRGVGRVRRRHRLERWNCSKPGAREGPDRAGARRRPAAGIRRRLPAEATGHSRPRDGHQLDRPALRRAPVLRTASKLGIGDPAGLVPVRRRSALAEAAR